MIRVRIQIGDGGILDTFDGWGFIYMDADERTEAPIKKRETISYAEEAGEHTDPRTVQDAFDYKVKFLIECPNRNLENANAKIAAFNSALYTTSYNSDIRTYKEVTFYNDYNRVKIVGIPEPIAQPTDFFRKQDGSALDCAQVELKIRVENPSKCDFNMSVVEKPDEPNVPSDTDTTTDALGIEWINTHFIGDTEVKISKPLSIFPNLASFTKVIDGQTIHYYNREAILSILNIVGSYYYGSYDTDYILDSISLMAFSGLSMIEPMNFRTVWQPIIVENSSWIRGDVIVEYPQMGYYKNGLWHQGDTYFFDNNELYLNELKEENGGFVETNLKGDDVAIPMKLIMVVYPENSASMASTMSLFGNKNLNLK